MEDTSKKEPTIEESEELLIDGIKKLNDKEAVKTIYKDFTSDVIDRMFESEETKKYYKDFIRYSMILTVTVANKSDDDELDAKVFLGRYFALLKNNLITQCSSAMIVIEQYESSLDELIESSKDNSNDDELPDKGYSIR